MAKVHLILVQLVGGIVEVEEFIHLLDGGHSEGVGAGSTIREKLSKRPPDNSTGIFTQSWKQEVREDQKKGVKEEGEKEDMESSI